MSYISEFHGLKYRSRIMMSMGIFFSLANIMMPVLAWIVIPNPWFNFTVVKGYFDLHTWQTFLLICALPSFISCISVASFLPESPKFLMSRGHNEAAMKVFRTVYKINNGDKLEYPVS